VYRSVWLAVDNYSRQLITLVLSSARGLTISPIMSLTSSNPFTESSTSSSVDALDAHHAYPPLDAHHTTSPPLPLLSHYLPYRQNTANDHPLILPVHSFGLANRLRLLASGIILSAHVQRPLLVDWQPSDGCNITLAELFPSHNEKYFGVFGGSSAELKRLIARRDREISDSVITKATFVSIAEDLNYLTVTGGILLSRGMMPVLSTDERKNAKVNFTTIVKSNGMFMPEGMDCRGKFMVVRRRNCRRPILCISLTF
jgi:hypothetical protein